MTLTIPDAVALVAGVVIPLAALTLAAARFVVSRMDRAEDKNERAHAAITENVRAVDERAERRAEAHRLALEAHRLALEKQGATLQAVARDVSFLAGRQAERDARAAGADRGTAP